ncbi:MAG: chemotaxis protein CheW [Armatimonadota bacterium]
MNDAKNEIIDDESCQLVVFELSGEAYGVDIGSVNTIIRMQEVTEVPRTPDYVEGVINLRGNIIPVVDLRKRFGLACGEITKFSRIVVVETSGQLIGMIVDAVLETLRMPNSAIEPPSPVVLTVDSQYVQGVGKLDDKLVIMLDLEQVMTVHTVETLTRKESASTAA